MTRLHILLLTIYYSLFTILFIGCSKPTYPKDKLSESAQKILKKEYNLDGKVKLVGSTLYLEVELPELISTDEFDLSKKILKKLQGAVLTLVRISLSSDAKIDTLVTIANVKNYDFCVRIIQRLEDIKHFLYLKISKSDYEKRLIFEILPYSKIEYKHLTLKEFVARLIVSQYNMLLKTNPFISGLLNNIHLEFNSFKNDSIVLNTKSPQMRFNSQTEKFFEKIITKSYSDVLKKYSLFDFPKLIKIVDKNQNNILTIKTY